MSIPPKRTYNSASRRQAADATQARVCEVAAALFARHGVDKVTIAQIAKGAGVASSTVYALFKSKEGILRALMRNVMFGPRFEAVQKILHDVTDPVRLVALTGAVARAIYESESTELGLMRGVSAFSPALRHMEAEFEQIRYEMQEARLKRLFEAGLNRADRTFEMARALMWTYTSRETYRMLVNDRGWAPADYEAWLSEALVRELVDEKNL